MKLIRKAQKLPIFKNNLHHYRSLLHFETFFSLFKEPSPNNGGLGFTTTTTNLKHS